MKLLFVGSEIRHELGCAASLALLGYDVIYFHVGSKYEPLSWRETCLDYACLKVKILEIPHPMLFQTLLYVKSLIPKAILGYSPDVVISTPSVPYYIGKYLASLHDVPLILRVWGVRANKLIDHLLYGKNYPEIARFPFSVLHTLFQVYNSRALVTMDNSTTKFLKKFSLKEIRLIYPTYAANYKYKSNNATDNVSSVIEQMGDNYVLSIVTIGREKSVARTVEWNLLRILLFISKQLPDVKVIIVGTSIAELKHAFRISNILRNLHLMDKIYDDDLLKYLYKNASIVIAPIFYRSVSNRLLEALFYKKPILTNSIALELHPVLKDVVIMSNNYYRYPEIIKVLLKQDTILDEFQQRVKTVWDRFFSSKVQAREMLKVIKEVI
jgi:glycosyltransferase involved in cell wall biosynthesis